MNRIFTFLIAMLLIFVVGLLNFEAPPSASQDTNGGISTEALAEFNDDDVNENFGFGFKTDSNYQKSDDSSSVSPRQAFDPVTLLLLGSGLIGIAGLVRKKI